MPVAEEASADPLRRLLADRAVRTVFQPIVDLDARQVVAFEALSRGPLGRWERPEVLFAAARSAGLLAELDQVCREMAVISALAAGIAGPFTVFVNVEPEILDGRLLQLLRPLLRQAAAGGLDLAFEITGRAVSARPAELLASVRPLREAGVKIAIDDVGADDTSLALLPLLQPDVVKLDLRGVQRRPPEAVVHVMHAVNAYAEAHGAVVVAEGIETDEQLAVAVALGARLGQGHLFGVPAPTVDLASRHRLSAFRRTQRADGVESPAAIQDEGVQLPRTVAGCDPLTGLPDRLGLLDRCAALLAAGRATGTAVALLVVDVDDFEAVNAEFGAAAGDAVLVELAERLTRACRTTDLIARIGAARFLIVLTGLRADTAAVDARNAADALRTKIQEPVLTADGVTAWVGVAVGVSVWPDDGDDAALLVRTAEQRRYAAKALQSRRRGW